MSERGSLGSLKFPADESYGGVGAGREGEDGDGGEELHCGRGRKGLMRKNYAGLMTGVTRSRQRAAKDMVLVLARLNYPSTSWDPEMERDGILRRRHLRDRLTAGYLAATEPQMSLQ